MRALLHFIERVARWPVLLGAFVAFVLANVVILAQVSRFETLTNGVRMLEVLTMLDQNFYEVVRSYGPEGLSLYRTVIQPLDIVYPATAGVFFALALAALTTRLFPAASPWRALPLLGLLMTLMDWLENLGVFFILNTLTRPVEWLDPLTKAFIVMKNLTGWTAIVTLLVLLVVWAARRLQQRRRGTVRGA